MLLGEPAPPPLGDVPAHVLNPFGEMNEAWVEARRGVPGPEVLAEFVETTNRRIDDLRAMTAEQFDTVGWSPVGEVPYREFMATRILDSWAHEQDIRRALGPPGRTQRGGRAGRAGPVRADHALRRGQAGGAARRHLGAVRRDRGHGPPGPGGGGRRPGRAGSRADADDPPTVTLTMDQEAFWRWASDGCDPTRAAGRRTVSVDGDIALGHRVLGRMAFMI